MAFALPIGELVLSGLEAGEATNIVEGAETIASQFKNEIFKGGAFGVAEGALFGAGEKLYDEFKKDLGYDNPKPTKKRKGSKRMHS